MTATIHCCGHGNGDSRGFDNYGHKQWWPHDGPWLSQNDGHKKWRQKQWWPQTIAVAVIVCFVAVTVYPVAVIGMVCGRNRIGSDSSIALVECCLGVLNDVIYSWKIMCHCVIWVPLHRGLMPWLISNLKYLPVSPWVPINNTRWRRMACHWDSVMIRD